MIDVLMPALSPTMTEGKLSRWLKAEGDDIRAGDVIAEIETDKATMEVEAVDEGRLDKILVAEGTEGVAVNTPIATLAGEAESPAPAPAAVPASARAQAAAPQAAHVAVAAPAVERDWGPSKPTTVREALRDAMAAELEADANVFLMGEEGRAISGCV